MALKKLDIVKPTDVTTAIESSIRSYLISSGRYVYSSADGEQVIRTWVQPHINNFKNKVANHQVIKISDVYDVIWRSMREACRRIHTVVWTYPTTYTNSRTWPAPVSSMHHSISPTPLVDETTYYNAYLSQVPKPYDIISTVPITDLIGKFIAYNQTKEVTRSEQSNSCYTSCHRNCHSNCHKDCHGSSRGRR